MPPIHTLDDDDWVSHLFRGICLLFWHILRLPFDLVSSGLHALWELSASVVRFLIGSEPGDEGTAFVFIMFSAVIFLLLSKILPYVARLLGFDCHARSSVPNERTFLVAPPRTYVG